MTKYIFEYVGLIEIEADNEDEAYKKFNATDNALLGKNVHDVELLENE